MNSSSDRKFSSPKRTSPETSLLRHSGIYLVTRFTGAGLQLLLLILLTRQLVPEEYGKISLFVAAYSFSVVVFCNPWRHTVARFLPEEGQQLSRFLGIIARSTGMSLLIFVVLVVLVNNVSLGRDVSLGMIALPLTIAVVAGTWTEVNLELHRRSLAPYSYLRLFIIRSFSHLIFAALGAYIFNSGLGVIAGLAVGHVIAACTTPLFRWVRAVRSSSGSSNKWSSSVKPWLLYSIPLSLAELINSTQVYVDRFMVAAALNVKAVGLYSASHDFAWMGLHMVSLVAYLSFFPLAVSVLERNNLEEYRTAMVQGFTLLFGLSLAASVGLVMLADPIAQLILGQDFQTGAADLMRVIAIGHLLFALKVYWLDTSFSFMRRTLPLLAIGVVMVALNMIGNVFLIPQLGVLGASVATAIASLAGCIMSAVIVWTIGRGNTMNHLPIVWSNIIKLIAAVAVMALVLHLLPQTVSLPWLIFKVILGGLVFLVSVVLLRLSFTRTQLLQ